MKIVKKIDTFSRSRQVIDFKDFFDINGQKCYTLKMSNIKIVRLSEQRELSQEANQLIEDNFDYSSPHSFSVDFYPLVEEKNNHHRFILLADNILIGHIALKEKIFCHLDYEAKAYFIGGIAIKKEFQKKGYFKLLMEHVLKTYESEACFFALWSNQAELYQKHGFHLSVGICQIDGQGSINDFEKTKFYLLDTEDKNKIKKLYEQTYNSSCFSLKRDSADWLSIEKITSSDLYLKRVRDKIVLYFFKGKGKDLDGICHEVGFEEEKNLKELIQNSTFRFWLSENQALLSDKSLVQYSTFIKIGNHSLFKGFIEYWSDGELSIKKITKDYVDFTFDGETFELAHQDFLVSLFGPYPIKEFQSFNKNIFISGLDSV